MVANVSLNIFSPESSFVRAETASIFIEEPPFLFFETTNLKKLRTKVWETVNSTSFLLSESTLLSFFKCACQTSSRPVFYRGMWNVDFGRWTQDLTDLNSSPVIPTSHDVDFKGQYTPSLVLPVDGARSHRLQRHFIVFFQGIFLQRVSLLWRSTNVKMEAILQDILVNTYNPDKQLRAQAEEALKNFIFAKGILLFLQFPILE